MNDRWSMKAGPGGFEPPSRFLLELGFDIRREQCLLESFPAI